MCRHFAYLGPQVPLEHLVISPPFGLMRQAWKPRRQQFGNVNVDGFGLGWYVEGEDRPVRYRRTLPIWADANLVDLLRPVRTGAALGAVRGATEGNAVVETANAPFTSGRWLFSHNGILPGWPDAAAELASQLSWPALARIQNVIDSTLLWALVLDRLEAGADPVETIRDVTVAARRIPNARVNLLLHTGDAIVATAAGDSLCYLHGEHPDPEGRPSPAVIVASEPFDDTDGWVDVPPDHLLAATADSVEVVALPAPLLESA
ncbi:MAG: ergothioneine biosynthesis protein EgtC [Sporichthyaceae bacterium]